MTTKTDGNRKVTVRGKEYKAICATKRSKTHFELE